MYTVNDSQGRTIGLFNDIDKAKDALVGHAESICDDIVLVDKPSDKLPADCVVATVVELYTNGILFDTHNEGCYVIEKWCKIDEVI